MASISTAIASKDNHPIGVRATVRYRGIVLIPQDDFTWLVRPERSPMHLLPFRAPASSLADIKALVDWRLGQGRLKVISSRARCHASQCEHSPDVVAQFLLTRVN